MDYLEHVLYQRRWNLTLENLSAIRSEPVGKTAFCSGREKRNRVSSRSQQILSRALDHGMKESPRHNCSPVTAGGYYIPEGKR
jgi:hypothetical protein